MKLYSIFTSVCFMLFCATILSACAMAPSTPKIKSEYQPVQFAKLSSSAFVLKMAHKYVKVEGKFGGTIHDPGSAYSRFKYVLFNVSPSGQAAGSAMNVIAPMSMSDMLLTLKRGDKITIYARTMMSAYATNYGKTVNSLFLEADYIDKN